jgi:trigger factor
MNSGRILNVRIDNCYEKRIIKLNVLKSEKKEKGIIDVLIEVSPEEYDAAAGKAFAKNKNRVSVPGFRKGKAPRRIIERMYGADVFLNDSLEIVYPDLVKFISDDSEYKIVSQPQITDIDSKEEGGGINVTLTFTVYPDVKLGEYKGVSVSKNSYDVPEIEIDNEIAAIRVKNARIESVERPAKDGDIAVIDFEGFLDGVSFDGGKGENHELELGSNSLIPGFEEKVAGMKIGEERDIDLVFPEQYAEDFAGKPVVFKVKLNEVKEKQLPDIDDEFAKDVSEFDTLAEYRADIRERLEKARKAEVDDAFESALMDKIVENLEVEVPDAMVEERMDQAMKNLSRQLSAYKMDPAQYFKMLGMTPESFRESSRLNSEKQIKTSIALEKIAELENIEISDEEIEKEYEDAAKELDRDLSELKESIDKENLVHDLKMRAALKLVLENAVPIEAKTEKTKEDKPKKEKSKSKKKGDES